MKDLALGVIILTILICASLSLDSDPYMEALDKNNASSTKSCEEQNTDPNINCNEL